MNVVLVQKGERGLFIDNGGSKLMFPDRSWKDASQGFAADVKITKDKGTYAFVSGRMLQTEDISVADIDVNEDATYRVGEIDGSKFILEWSSGAYGRGVYRVLVRINDGGLISTERIALPVRCSRIVEYLNIRSEHVDLTKYFVDNCPQLNFEDDDTYYMEMTKLLKVLHSEYSFVGNKADIAIRVYNSSLVLVKRTSVLSSLYNTTSAFRYQGELGSGKFVRFYTLGEDDIDQMWTKADKFDLDEIKDWALCNGIFVSSKKFETAFDDRLVYHVFECQGQGVVVYAFNLNGYDLSWLETEEAAPYVALVDESLERAEYLKKRMGKMGIGVDKLSTLNVANWLFPFHSQE